MTEAPLSFTARNITPTAEQWAVQTTRAKHVLVEANAGAAKTTSLALRIGQALARGAQPATILALTYTDPAVTALRQQLRLVGVPEEVIAQIHLHTFDSFSATRLKAIEGEGVLMLETQEQVKPYVERAVERAQSLPEERYPDELAVSTPASALVEGLLESVALLKGRMLIEQLNEDLRMTPPMAEELGFDYATLRFRMAYEVIRRGGHPDRPAFRFHGDATYDLARAVVLEELAYEDSPLKMGLTLIVVDEMHDTNKAMFTVLKALLDSNRRAAFVGVGDRDQVIHSIAGAEAGFMGAHFMEEIGAPIRLPLSATHRFGPALARAVGALAGKPYEAFQQQETRIEALHAENHRVMAATIAQLAREHMKQAQLQDMRILLRRPEYSILLERELAKLGVDYRCQGFQPFLQRPEVLLVRGLQAYGIDDFTGFTTKAMRVATLNAMMLFAGAWIESSELRHLDAVSAQRRAIDEVAAQPDGMRDFIEGQILRNASSTALPRLRKALSLLKTNDVVALDQSLIAALDPVALAGAVLVRKDDVDQVLRNIEQLLRLVVSEDAAPDDVFRLFHEMEIRRANARSHSRVTLSSIEVSKGLEFDHVVIPHLTAREFAGGGVSAAENRNLLYVAMTRARHRLTLAYDPSKPSRYLREAGLA